MAEGRKAGLRVSTAVRPQVGWEMVCLDDLLASDHRGRQVWAYVERCDLTALYEKIRAVEGEAGRAPIDPAILMALWLYATLEGIGSARLLERLCERDLAYRWICGGVGVNYHTLSDFRVEAGTVLDGLLTRSMAALAATGVVGLECLAVDGVRVRASAGASSFRRAARLSELHAMAEKKVAALSAERDADPAAASKRASERDLREAQARKARIEAAQQAAQAITDAREREANQQRRRRPKRGGKEARASTTDAEARIMKMADGGYRPAYNVQIKTDPKSDCIVGVEVTNKASDRGQLVPAVDEIAQRYGARPGRLLADGGYDGKDDIEELHRRGIEVFCPITGSGGKPVVPAIKRGDGEGVIAWRERMSREESTAIYAQRIACERPHADMRNRGLQRFLVRGLKKVKAAVLWYVTAYNFLQIQRLAPQPA
jgi:transposase